MATVSIGTGVNGVVDITPPPGFVGDVEVVIDTDLGAQLDVALTGPHLVITARDWEATDDLATTAAEVAAALLVLLGGAGWDAVASGNGSDFILGPEGPIPLGIPGKVIATVLCHWQTLTH